MLFRKSGDVFHRLGILFDGIGELLRPDGDRTTHEFRDIVALHELTMVVGIGTRQLKGLAATPVTVDMVEQWQMGHLQQSPL